MTERKCRFSLNSAITGLSESDGKFDEEAHRQQVLPLRGRLMQLDGVKGCYIARYALEIDFYDDITNEETVKAHVQDAVRWAADQEGFFPIRGQKTPAATMVRPEPQKPIHLGKLFISFGTNVVAFPTSEKDEGWDDTVFQTRVQPLADQIVAFDGVRDYELRMTTASVTFDTRITDREAVQKHLVRILRDAAITTDAAHAREFFPFSDIGYGLPDLSFDYTEE